MKAVVEGSDAAVASESKRRYTIAVDFDGVLHTYETPWIDAATIPDPPVEGAIEWLNAMATKFDVVIFTTRGKTPEGVEAVAYWLGYHGFEYEAEVTAEKPPALVYVDDRAWRFEGPGTFPTAEQIHRALPWHKAEKPKPYKPTCDHCGAEMRTSGIDSWSCPKCYRVKTAIG